jgi:hypothetical protein
LPQNTIIHIASSVWKTGSRDIRDVLKIAKLCNPLDEEEDITRLITIHQKYRKTGKEYKILIQYRSIITKLVEDCYNESDIDN